ncbi:amidohydrolase family protein [Mangrovivirga sp. M17]|uniref:Amidohydrolase family protein n=1 Tax=Mangrovivirga halotolerans TaxID=2993936 RepID=A0ABT3RS21_9BACT|nr:amidohydrolase family protein [Mangrovivirga halotolerans]MCX2744144.1 amidohydrolase family protein [Mangrovivirga halotolerans]
MKIKIKSSLNYNIFNWLWLSFILLFASLSCGKPFLEEADVIIKNASIVDVESGEIYKNRTILISGDTILKVINSDEEEGFSADTIIDAKGDFVMPGLWDNHVHFRGGDSLIEENKAILKLFLAHGVTTVRDAGGDITPAVLEWREKIKNGKMDGPRIYTPGPKLDGVDPAWAGSIKVKDSEDVAKALDSLKSIKVDYVKTYDGSLTREAYYKILEQAEEIGLKVTGHMPLSADVLQAEEYGLDGTEHLYYIMKACSPVADSLEKVNPGYSMIPPLLDTYNEDLAEVIFEKLGAQKHFVTPTLYIGKVLAGLADEDHSKDPLLRFIGPGVQKTYEGRIERAKRAKESGSSFRSKAEEIFGEMIRGMYDAGVIILAGSDCGPYNSFVYPGQSLHGELKMLVEKGLTPQEALLTSINNGPKFFEIEEKYGQIEGGMVADIIILDQNPLEDINNLESVNTVIMGARVYNTNEQLK